MGTAFNDLSHPHRFCRILPIQQSAIICGALNDLYCSYISHSHRTTKETRIPYIHRRKKCLMVYTAHAFVHFLRYAGIFLIDEFFNSRFGLQENAFTWIYLSMVMALINTKKRTAKKTPMIGRFY